MPANGFVHFIERHHLAWYLVGLLDSCDLGRRLPADDVARLQRATRARESVQSRLLEELVRLAALFAQRDVEVILLKGAYLAERFFGGAHKRSFLDLDLFIRARQLRAAEQILAAAGYRRLSTFLLSRGATMRFTHGCDFARDGLRLDLHWSLGAHVSYRIDYDRVWSDRTRLGFRQRVDVLGDDDLVAFHLLSLFEDLDRGGARVRSLVDVYAMLMQLDAMTDWSKFWVVRRREGIARICAAVLGLFFVLFGSQRFPRCAESVAAAGVFSGQHRVEEIGALVEAAPGALANKIWAARWYECPRVLTLAWWAASLPFRLAVYSRH